jgi:hypothetical protein
MRADLGKGEWHLGVVLALHEVFHYCMSEGGCIEDGE